jgi:DNA helicase II / ATP-dependent DNA helicase PcrA
MAGPTERKEWNMRFDPLADHAPLPPEHPLSPQQEAVIDFVRNREGNAILEAVAGSGKTTTLIETCKYLRGPTAFAAFNKAIADEIGRKLLAVKAPRGIRAATFHSFGFQAWRKVAPRVRVEGKKMRDIGRKEGLPNHVSTFTTALVSLAKQNGIGTLLPETFGTWRMLTEHYDLEDRIRLESYDPHDMNDAVDLGIEWARKLLRLSIDAHDDIIDFDDMLYAPLYHGLQLPQHEWVLIDEAQDTNTVRRELAKRMMAPAGRLIAVGDRHQAIYGFTGATADALDQISLEFNCEKLPLTVSYRCSQSVIRHAQKLVPHIDHRPDAPEGSVSVMGASEFRKLIPSPDSAILCRVTKPLIEMAFDFLRRQIPCHVEGRDIGQSLLSLVWKWKKIKTVGGLAVRLEKYVEEESQRLAERGKEEKIEGLVDRVESLVVIMSNLSDDDPVEEIEKLIDKIFKDTEGHDLQSITLSTVHKAKGREWPTVYLYGRNKYMPSMYARQLWQIEQENNLIYVAITRAMNDLIEVQIP